MYIKFILVMAVLLNISSCAQAQERFQVSTPAYPSERSYSLDLPSPFDNMKLVIKDNDDRSPESITLIFSERTIYFSKEQLAGIEYIASVEFGVERSENQISSFKVIFENGSGKVIEDEEGIPGCRTPCVYLDKDILIFEIDLEYDITLMRRPL